MAKRTIRPVRVEGNVAFVTLTKGYVAVIDAADTHLVDKWNWNAGVETAPDGRIRTVYARRAERTPGGSTIHFIMHRIILGAPKGLEVDHIDGDGLNNRRANIRLATTSQNQHNQRPHADAKSPAKGVDLHLGRYWRARIMVRGVRKSLGLYATEEEAAGAYARASADLHGPFSGWVKREAAPRLQDKIDKAVDEVKDQVDAIKGGADGASSATD